MRERRPGIYSPDHIEAMQDILHDEETLNDLAGAHMRLPSFVRRRYGDQILTPQETIRFSTLFGHIIDSFYRHPFHGRGPHGCGARASDGHGAG